MKQKIKLGIILGVEFVAIAVILLLIFFAGKKSYTVTFDLTEEHLSREILSRLYLRAKAQHHPLLPRTDAICTRGAHPISR